MKLLFWNVQRLGGGSSDLKKAIIGGVLAEVFKEGVDWALLCEIVGDTELDDAPIQKQLGIVKQKAKKTSAQLGYAWVASDLSTGELSVMPVADMTVYAPSGETVRISKGGTNFHKLSKRAVAYVGHDRPPTGPRVYLYHANASAKAPQLIVQAVATCIDDVHQAKASAFVLIGDMNAEPETVRAYLDVNFEHADELVVTSGGKTHNAREGLTKAYDYCLHSTGATCAVTVLDISHAMDNVGKENLSDHLPIVVKVD